MLIFVVRLATQTRRPLPSAYCPHQIMVPCKAPWVGRKSSSTGGDVGTQIPDNLSPWLRITCTHVFPSMVWRPLWIRVLPVVMIHSSHSPLAYLIPHSRPMIFLLGDIIFVPYPYILLIVNLLPLFFYMFSSARR